MEKRELYDKFEDLSQNLMSMLAEVEAIKANVSWQGEPRGYL